MTTLVDTSILLRLPNPSDVRHSVTHDALNHLASSGESLVVSLQNYVEFRGAATRPIAVNGLGMTAADADAQLDILEKLFPHLADRVSIYGVWRRLCKSAAVSGKQVHDTRLVAVCIVHRVQTVLTWNPMDFLRFSPFVTGLSIQTPEDVMAGT